MKKNFLLILTVCFCIGMKGATHTRYGYGCDKNHKHKNNAFNMEEICSKVKDMDKNDMDKKNNLMLRDKANIIDNMDK